MTEREEKERKGAWKDGTLLRMLIGGLVFWMGYCFVVSANRI